MDKICENCAHARKYSPGDWIVKCEKTKRYVDKKMVCGDWAPQKDTEKGGAKCQH